MHFIDPHAIGSPLSLDWKAGLIIAAIGLYVVVVWLVDRRIYRERDARKPIPRRTWDQIAHGRQMRAMRKAIREVSSPWSEFA